MKLVFEIGDWVSVGGQPVQVYAVHTNKIAYHVGNDKTKPVKWAFINTVTPLIVAPYMFEDNGFKCDDCYVTVTRFGDSWNITHTRYDVAQPINSAMVRYLHELQHAMRLFGIDKKIQL